MEATWACLSYTTSRAGFAYGASSVQQYSPKMVASTISLPLKSDKKVFSSPLQPNMPASHARSRCL